MKGRGESKEGVPQWPPKAAKKIINERREVERRRGMGKRGKGAKEGDGKGRKRGNEKRDRGNKTLKNTVF